MAVEYVGGRIVKKAGADLTGKKYYGVKLDAQGDVVLAGAGEAIAILLEEGAAGKSVTIQYLGGTKMVAGAAIAAGVFGNTDANGKLVVCTEAVADTGTGAITGTKAFVLTLEAATAAGQLVPVAIVQGGLQ
ncbi:hypothetical protein [Petroclostridium sp. X23]|uniref:hypothetical protein n=1 Tax=Petroclostridium sp. X23 TaxID=3045146 RepID=UPI0024AC8600|nr:hypothetical protein [Petroclostridium sp. X23]WHH58302.1 hypothetical protein QKW49_21260 [Petroclostridium sp. X23]